MIRVLRLLEYTYPTVEAMADDQQRWGVPANGTRGPLGMAGKVIRSATLPLDVVQDDRLTQERLLQLVRDAQLAHPGDHGAIVAAFLGGYPLVQEDTATVEVEPLEPICQIPACGCTGKAHA